jgi:eukaryotic translation initiation factor 2C
MASRGDGGGGRWPGGRGGDGRGPAPGGRGRGRGSGGGRGPAPGGRGLGGERYDQQQPYGPGGMRGGSVGRGRSRGGAEATARSAPPPPVPGSVAPLPAVAGDASALSRDMGRLAVADPAPCAHQKLPQAPPASSKAIEPLARPGFGTMGRKVNVYANHFRVQFADKVICHYDVSHRSPASSPSPLLLLQ